jgi:hypothetical protein
MEENTQTPVNTATAEENAELTITDLAAVRSIIDVASQRGAFKPNEMVAVGTVYTKLEKFLAAAQAASQAQKATPNA